MTILFHVRCASVSAIPAIGEWRFRHYQGAHQLVSRKRAQQCDNCFFAITALEK